MKRLLLILSFTAFFLHSQAQSREGGEQPGSLRFYPNPATTYITFDLPKAQEKGYSLQVYSFMGGRKMFEQTNLPERTTINLSDYTRGVYIYQLRDRSGKVIESGKFQVSK